MYELAVCIYCNISYIRLINFNVMHHCVFCCVLAYVPSMMAMSSATDEKQNYCFTGYVDTTAVSLKSDILVYSHLPSSDELDLLIKLPKDKKKLKKLIRTSDWPMNHEVRRSLWVTLCSTIDSFTAASDGCSYHETVQEVFGNGMVLFIAVLCICDLSMCLFMKARKICMLCAVHMHNAHIHVYSIYMVLMYICNG